MLNNLTIYRKNKLTFGSWISASIYSLLLFSPLSFKIFDIGGRYIFEAAVAAAFIYYLIVKDTIGQAFEIAIRKKSSELFLVFLAIVPIFFLGWVRTGNFFDAYSDFRSNFIFVFGFGHFN